MTKRSLSIPVVVLIAVVALVLGSFGTATAAGITSKQVKKIAAKVVKKKASGLTVAKAATADTATTAASATTAGTVSDNAITSAKVANGSITKDDLAAGAIPTVLFARINTSGAVTVGSPGVSSVRNSLGNYTVTFPRDASTCAALVTPFGFDQETYFISTQTAAGAITVDIEVPSTGAQEDSPFNIGLIC